MDVWWQWVELFLAHRLGWLDGLTKSMDKDLPNCTETPRTTNIRCVLYEVNIVLLVDINVTLAPTLVGLRLLGSVAVSLSQKLS